MTGSIQDLKTDGAFFKYLNKKNEYKQQVRETMVVQLPSLRHPSLPSSGRGCF